MAIGTNDDADETRGGQEGGPGEDGRQGVSDRDLERGAVDDLARHLANAGNPEGAYGATLLRVMNSGEHERLASWALGVLGRALPDGPHAGAAGPRMLDLGCGGGANLVRLRGRFGGHASGIDHSPVSVETSRATCEGSVPAGTWDVRLGDVAALPFADASFDLVSAFETVYFWDDAPAAFAQVARVLAPGGAVLVCDEAGGTPEVPDWARPDFVRLYHAADLSALLEGAGLAVARVESTPEGWLCVVATLPA